MQRDEVSPFGFHFELDKKKYEARKKAIRRKKIFKWLAWIAYYHHKFGIRHLLLVFFLAAYVFIGGAIFLALEAPNEMQDLKATIIEMNAIFSEEAGDVINATFKYNDEYIREEKVKKILKAYYKDLLDAEGRFHGSVWHKAENLDLNLMWYYSSATFYCMTLFSTIGYGTIAPQTAAGRALSIIYASVGIPLMLVVLGDIGEGFQNILTKIYIFFLLKYKKLRKQEPPEDLEDIVLPIWLALTIVAIYLGLCTLFITLFDHSEGKMPGIDSASAFYFTFISLTTIGLGDVMPYNIQYSPILAAVFLLGLALISIVNTSIYAQCYDGFFNFLEYMESKLEVIHRSTHKPHGHKIFQDLEPCILLLVCSFPHLGADMRNQALEGILKPAGTEKKDKGNKTVTYSQVVRKRTISYSGEQEGAETKTKSSGRLRAPTLGALGGRDLAKFRKQRQMARRNSDASKSAGAASKVVRRGSDAGSMPPSLDEWKKEITKKDKPKEEKKPVEAPKPEAKPVEEPKEQPKPTETVIVVPAAAGSSKDVFDMSDLYGDAPFTRPPHVEASEDSEAPPTAHPIVVHTEDETRSLESEEQEDEDEGPPGGSRPPPLISLPIPHKGDSDSDDDDDDDDWQPPTSKFANLKRGSVFVPKGTLADDSDDETEGPSVEYIP